MGNTTSTPLDHDTLDTIPPLGERIRDADMDAARSQDRDLYYHPEYARTRYMTILIENGQVNPVDITALIDECIQMVNIHRYDLDYIKSLFDYIVDQILAKKCGNADRDRGRNVKELLRFAKYMYERGDYNSTASSSTVMEGAPLMNIVENALFRLNPHFQPDWM